MCGSDLIYSEYNYFHSEINELELRLLPLRFDGSETLWISSPETCSQENETPELLYWARLAQRDQSVLQPEATFTTRVAVIVAERRISSG